MQATELIGAIDKKVFGRLLPAKKPNLSVALSNRLYSVYAEDMAGLEELLERDLRH